jgi:hypothetical protein
MGTGTGGADPRDTIKRLIETAINYFEQKPSSVISTVYFLAYTDHQRDFCLGALAQAKVDRLPDNSR